MRRETPGNYPNFVKHDTFSAFDARNKVFRQVREVAAHGILRHHG
jgi:hypothetical protein